MSEESRLASNYVDRLNTLQKSGLLEDLSALRQENRELETLINDAAALVALSGIDEMIAFVTARLLDRFIPQRLLYLVEETAGKGIRQYGYRNLKPDPDVLPDAFYEPMRAWFLDSPLPIPFNELERRIDPDSLGPELRAFDPRMVIPMFGIGGLHGLVLLGGKMIGDEYSGAELMYVNSLMRFLSIGIQNSIHHTSSITDAKTGLYNHRYFIKRLDDELARVARHGSNAGIIMIDVDHFKNVNDSYGHVAGDEVLLAIARAVRGAIRAVDVAARFGGEEFCVLAIECQAEKLVEFASRIREAVESLRVPIESNLIQATVSLGCCHIDGSLALEGQGYIDKADKALYQSKANGRNRVTLYHFGFLDRASAKLRLSAPSSPRTAGESELVPIG
jgi:diguanylate cyclase (GGDEF)-like protein